MNIAFSEEELAFQQTVKTFLQEKLPADISERRLAGLSLNKEMLVRWQKILFEQGWLAPNWPVEYGGTGWTATEKYIFENECTNAGAPEVIPFGSKMVAPVIYSYGSQEQKDRFLPDILASNVWWCQGFSEPGAGSDLASLKTTAVRDGDSYLVNGTKTWTTLAQYADWIFCLARTGGPEVKNQQAISFLLIDMKTPGITVSPIIMLDGEHEINEVHFDNVRVPAENLIGQEGRGWTYAKMLLTHERTNIAGVSLSKRRLDSLKKLAKKTDDYGNCLMNESAFALKIADVEIELLALEYTEMRTLASVSTGGAPGPESSILKIKGTEVAQAIDEMYVEAAGYFSVPYVPEQFSDGPEANDYIGDGSEAYASSVYFNNRKASIYGGSNEIQKNIICKAVLGL